MRCYVCLGILYVLSGDKMGVISLKRKIPSRNQRKRDNSIAKIFVDRESQRNVFKDHIAKISKEYSLLLFYSGAGGSGKTALIRELENLLLTKSSIYKYASYDFKEDGADMITTLNSLKKILMVKYNAEFPLYEKGYIYYLQKRGDMVSREHIEEVFNKSSVLQKTLGHMGETIKTLDNANMMSRGAKIFAGGSLGVLSFLDRTYDTSLILKILKMGVTGLDKLITERAQKAKEKEDVEYARIIQELEDRNGDPQADVIKEYLPILFARDVSDWLRETNSKLIFFLDTYESLTGDEKNSTRHEKLVSINYDVPVDWWIEELLARTNSTLWVIAGRSEISKIGEDIDIIRDDTLFPLTALESTFADKFLLDSGIENPKLRQDIIDLTDGYPNYLSVCVDTYKEILLSGNDPVIADFGEKREIIVKRLINFMDEGARNMLKRLCILGTWTDDIAQSILSILRENNIDTYNRIKNLSFIFSQSVGSTSKKIICFDRSIQKILFDHLREKNSYLIEETRKAANDFFYTVFYNTSHEKKFILIDDDLMQFFKFWYEIILRTINDAEELVIQYSRNFMPLIDIFEDTFVEGVIKSFQDKVKIIEGVENIFYAYFEHLLARIKLRNSKDKEAILYAESAYCKIENLCIPKEHTTIKISVVNTLADVYKKLKRTENEISLRQKVLLESERFFQDEVDDRIITAKKNLADALERGDKKNRARILRKEILITLKRFNDERTILAVADYAYALERANKHKYAVSFREKIVEFYRNTTNTDKLISEIKNLIVELGKFSSEEYLEKKLSLQRELVTLYVDKDGEYSSNVVWVMLEVFQTLENLNRKKEATDERDNLAEKFKLRIKETSTLEEKVTLIKNLIDILKDTPKSDEAIKWHDRVKQNLREIVSIKLREPVENYEVAIFFADNLINELDLYSDYHEVIELQRSILRLTENNPNSTVDEIIPVMKYFAYMLATNPEGYEEALALRNKVVDILKQKYFYDKTNKKVLSAMEDIAVFFEKIVCDPYLALSKRLEIFHFLEENEASSKQILDAMQKITKFYIYGLDNYVEALVWSKQILNYCRENFSSDSSEVISAMENLASAYENLDEHSTAAKLRNEIVKMKIEKCGEKSNSDVIKSQKIIADQLHEIGNYEKELEIRKKVITLYRKNYEENSISRYELINALNDVVGLLYYLGDEKEAYTTQKIIIDELQKDYTDSVAEFGEYSDDAIMKIDAIADTLHNVGHYEEELMYRKKMVELRKSIDEHSKGTIYALERLAEFFAVTGNAEEEIKVRTQVVNICENNLKAYIAESADDKDKLLVMYQLLIAEKDLGNEENVAQLEEKILTTQYFISEKRSKVFGNNHLSTISALEELANDLHAYGYSLEELKVRREILERLKENSKDEFNEDILNEMKALAKALNNSGNFEDSLRLWQEILNFCRSQKSGAIDSETLNAMNNIAVIFENLTDYRAVLKIRREILDIYQKKYSVEKYQNSILQAMYDETSALIKLEDYNAAILILRQIVELYTKKYGQSGYMHEHTINAIKRVANLLELTGDFESALAERKKIVELLEKKYPFGHEKIIVAMKNVANLLEEKGDYEQSLEWREKIFEHSKDFIEPSYELATTLDHLKLHIKANKVRKSILRKLEKVLDEYTNIYGQKSDKVIEILEKLSLVAKTVDMYEEVIKYDKLLVNILVDFKGHTTKKTLDAMVKLADDCENESENMALIYRENVSEIQQQILNFRLKHLGNEHSLTMDMREDLARTFEQLGYTNESAELQKENLDAYEIIINRRIDVFTEMHEITLEALNQFANALEKIGCYDDAEKVRRRICNLYQIKFRKDGTNFKIISSLERLADLLEKKKNLDETVIVRNKIARLLKEKYGRHEFCDHVINALKNIVRLHEMRKDFSAAVSVQENVVGLLKKRYAGYENHSTLTEEKNYLSNLRERIT